MIELSHSSASLRRRASARPRGIEEHRLTQKQVAAQLLVNMNQRFVSLKTRAGQTTANDVALLGGLYSDVLSAPRMSREVADANRFDARECHCVVVFNGASGDANCAHQNASLIHYG